MAFSWASWCEEENQTPKDASGQGLGQGNISAKYFLIRKRDIIYFMPGMEREQNTQSLVQRGGGGGVGEKVLVIALLSKSHQCP